MPDSGISNNWLVFRPRIEIISTVKKRCLNIVIRDIFQDILAMNILKNSDDDVSPVGLSNIIKVRFIILPVAYLIKMTE